MFKVSLLTVQNDGSCTTAFTFDIDELVKTLKNPKEKLAKVLREEKNPSGEVLDTEEDCRSDNMQRECVQRRLFCDILEVIFRSI